MSLCRIPQNIANAGCCLLILVLGLYATPSYATNLIHHDLQVKLDPGKERISVVDIIQLPTNVTDNVEFSLRDTFTVATPDAKLISTGKSEQQHLKHYRLTNLPENKRVKLNYQGTIRSDKIKGQFGMPEYLLSRDGVYLDSASTWIPHFTSHPWLTFELQVEAPSKWQVISQGKRESVNGAYRFSMPHPQDEIYLLAGPFTRYQQMQDDIELVVYLLKADAKLAQDYLQATAHYVKFYSELIGPYPYAKFAIVENRWQTGYGMPSFTLLGSRVIRLPFILHTSLPHEIVHNWWGNGVYVDYIEGNWSEGLTAYLSDHLESEWRGEGAAYRRKALERYANFAAEGRDFPLSRFRSRHSDASQAVGYSKSLMLFHMLRNQAGDEAFYQRIRDFWQRYQFTTASYPDVIRILYDGDEQAYENFVSQWLDRTGAPILSLGKVRVSESEAGYRLMLEVNQQQTTPPYSLQVPVDVKLAGMEMPLRKVIDVSGRRSHITLDFEQRPREVTLDPDYDVFRLLHPQERPSSLGRLFGANQLLLVLPTRIDQAQIHAWRQLAEAWRRRYDNIKIINDNELSQLPVNTAVFLLGWQNQLVKTNRQRFQSTHQQLKAMGATVDDQQFNIADHAVVLLDPDNSRAPLGMIGAQHPDSIAALARKLPHYSSYGRLIFELPKVNNIVKQSLPVAVSPLKRQLSE